MAFAQDDEQMTRNAEQMAAKEGVSQVRGHNFLYTAH